uniref:GPI inositol-deacylase n=1 Tax=Oncorhynchus kisutch TaxID=8019 RepID=A0A8C7CQV4_ONCKI
MRVATVAFYGCALGLLAMGLREMFSGFEENRCTMTYMFEYPEYRRIALPRRVARQYPAYGLYLYGEGQYAQDTRGLKLAGAPVLFLPGNAGSYKQARSLGSVALRKAEALEGGVHLNVFTIDFNEELVALYGGSLRRQTHFLHESIKAILRLYKDHEAPPHSVVLVGHSMGGVVARALFTLPRFSPRLVSLIITQASPHQAPVLSLDAHLLEFYSAVRQRWVGRAEDLRNVTVLSVGGGYRDYQVRSGLTSLPCPQDDPSKLSLVVTAVPRTWVSTDHLSIVWCKELVLATVRAFFDLIEPETGQVSITLISGMLHTSRPDNSTGVLLQLHTAPNCLYKVLPTKLNGILFVLRFCGPVLPVYVAVALLLACGGQMSSVVRMGRPLQMSHAVARSLQPHKVDLPVYLLHLLLRYSWFQDGWSTLHLPPLDALPATSPDGMTQEGLPLNEDWPRLLSPLLYVLGAAIAFWGSVLLRLFLRLLSLLLAPLHRPSVSRDCGTLRRRTQLLLILCLSVLGWASCGALSITATFLLHLYRVSLGDQLNTYSLNLLVFLWFTDVCLCFCPGSKATDDREVSESYAEPGKSQNYCPLKMTSLKYSYIDYNHNYPSRRPRNKPTKRKALGKKRKALGKKRKALGKKRKALGKKRKALGTKRKALGKKRKALGKKRKAPGTVRPWTANLKNVTAPPCFRTRYCRM